MRKELWLKEERAAFEGWDFSHLDGRWEEGKIPWSYRDIIDEYLKEEHHLLDMGTGGGEFLLSLQHPNNRTSVTEGWQPNYELCKEKLSPLGIDVQKVEENNKLNFEDDSFDIIINRHEDYSPREVERVLKPGGVFITQQVGGDNNIDLARRVTGENVSEFAGFDLQRAKKELEGTSLGIIREDECFPKLKFYDIGAFVYFAKIISWEFPGFKVETHMDRLIELQEECDREGFIQSTEERYLLICRNNK